MLISDPFHVLLVRVWLDFRNNLFGIIDGWCIIDCLNWEEDGWDTIKCGRGRLEDGWCLWHWRALISWFSQSTAWAALLWLNLFIILIFVIFIITGKCYFLLHFVTFCYFLLHFVTFWFWALIVRFSGTFGIWWLFWPFEVRRVHFFPLSDKTAVFGP